MTAASKQQGQQYLAGMLVFVFSLLLFRSYSRQHVRRALPAVSSAAVKPAPLLPQLMRKHYDQIDAQINEASVMTPSARFVGYAANRLRDPFKSLLPKKPLPVGSSGTQGSGNASMAIIKEAQKLPPVLSLQGVWWADQPCALIKGRVYHVGETIEGATVKSISREGVVMDFSGKPFLLAIAGGKGLVQAQGANAASSRR